VSRVSVLEHSKHSLCVIVSVPGLASLNIFAMRVDTVQKHNSIVLSILSIGWVLCAWCANIKSVSRRVPLRANSY